MNAASRCPRQAASTPVCREYPAAVERVLSAARRVHPSHGLCVTFAPAAECPPWEFHPFKRWLVLRTGQQGRVLEAVTCTMLAPTAGLGKGTVTTVPESLSAQYHRMLGALLAALAEVLGPWRSEHDATELA